MALALARRRNVVAKNNSGARAHDGRRLFRGVGVADSRASCFTAVRRQNMVDPRLHCAYSFSIARTDAV